MFYSRITEWPDGGMSYELGIAPGSGLQLTKSEKGYLSIRASASALETLFAAGLIEPSPKAAKLPKGLLEISEIRQQASNNTPAATAAVEPPARV